MTGRSNSLAVKSTGCTSENQVQFPVTTQRLTMSTTLVLWGENHILVKDGKSANSSSSIDFQDNYQEELVLLPQYNRTVHTPAKYTIAIKSEHMYLYGITVKEYISD